MSIAEKFKYRAKFTIEAAHINFNDNLSKKSLFAKASVDLEDLKKLLPEEVDLEKDQDLLYTCFNAAVVNLVNLNHDGIDTETALAVCKHFVKRPTNIEHDKLSIVGFITNAGFSSFSDSKILEEKNIDINSDEPFNISLSGIVWKSVAPYEAQIIADSADKDSYFYNGISASWEIGFNEYYILTGSTQFSKGKKIKAPEEIDKMKMYLRAEGGSGFLPDGTPVYRVIAGDDVQPLGCAYTFNPAAAVKGLTIASAEPSKPVENDKINKILAKIDKIENNLLKKEKNNVTINNNNMKFNTPEELYTNFAEASASDVRELLQKTIKESNDKFVESERAKADKEQELAKAQNDILEANQKMNELKQDFEKLQADIVARENQEIFNTRMESLSSKFDLTNDKVSKIVASRIKDMTNDQYTAWLSDEAELLLPKKVDTKPQSNASAGFIPNAGQADEPAEPAKKYSFGDDVTIQ